MKQPGTKLRTGHLLSRAAAWRNRVMPGMLQFHEAGEAVAREHAWEQPDVFARPTSSTAVPREAFTRETMLSFGWKRKSYLNGRTKERMAMEPETK